jgi:cell wall-associated NlpC family hydrolase
METPRTTRCIRPLLAATGLLIIVGCSSSPRFTPGEPVEPAGSGSSSGKSQPIQGRVPTGDARGEQVVRKAADYLGTPYRNGGTTPKGVDCSGLTYTVFQSFGVRLPRTSRDQARAGAPVSRQDLEAGDLIFFGSGSNVSHVGIYAGDGEFIHASTRSRAVRFDRLDNKYFRKRYITARRYL